MDTIRELPFAIAYAILFVIVFARANATYWLGRGATAGGSRFERIRARLESPSMDRARDIVARWGVAAVPLCFLTVGVQTAVNLLAGAMKMPLRRYFPAVALGSLIWALIYATAGTVLFTLLWRLVWGG
ncbi:DedA family protein [Dietzia sp.]|uniref:DedA family protein n=1 Tax=Dietzia sp. TaxID=1871616 RepID=UPI002FD88479